MAALMQHLEHPGALDMARRDLKQRREQMRNGKATHTKKAERFRARRDKFKTKDGATNIAHLLIDQAVRQLEDHMRNIEREMVIVDKALALLDTHGEEMPAQPTNPSGWGAWGPPDTESMHRIAEMLSRDATFAPPWTIPPKV